MTLEEHIETEKRLAKDLLDNSQSTRAGAVVSHMYEKLYYEHMERADLLEQLKVVSKAFMLACEYFEMEDAGLFYERFMQEARKEIDDKNINAERIEEDRWIPVSERLPEKNMACLVSVGNIHLTQIAVYSDLMQTINHKIFYQGDYGHENFMNITDHVKAWQPLPKPYELQEARK